jgi:hypothetical protein
VGTTAIVIFALQILLTTEGLSVNPAGASSFHEYATAQDGTYSSSYTGIDVARPDETINTTNSSTCTTYFTGYPIYQTEWLGDSDGDFMEIGTGHQCSGSSNFEYWYADYDVDGTFVPIWEKTITGGSSHTFWILGNGGDEAGYGFGVDSTEETWLSDLSQFQVARTGLESYDSTATVTAYTNSSLKYDHSYSGTWHSWTNSAEDVLTSPMCGVLISATSWKAGENTTC